MQIHTTQATRVGELQYRTAAMGGGSQLVPLPLLRVPTEGLVPAGLDAVLLTSDLQGVAPVPSRDGAEGLLGEAVVDWYATLAEAGLVPAAGSVGVVLAGDLFSAPRANERGATGDVGPVWSAFARDFAWVAGVAGNHDLFTSRISRLVQRHAHVSLLDGDVVEHDGLKLGGVGGIIGKKGKTNRRSPSSFVNALRPVLSARPDILVLHEGPPGPQSGQRGRPELQDALHHARVPLLVSGHVHWAEPFATVGSTTRINVDGRAVLLVPSPS